MVSTPEIRTLHKTEDRATTRVVADPVASSSSAAARRAVRDAAGVEDEVGPAVRPHADSFRGARSTLDSLLRIETKEPGMLAVRASQSGERRESRLQMPAPLAQMNRNTKQ